VLNDQYMLREVAALYDPEIPSHENEAYIAKVKELMAFQEKAMRGHSAGFGSRSHRGWIPPGSKEEEG